MLSSMAVKLFCFGQQTSCQELQCLLMARLLPLSPEGGEGGTAGIWGDWVNLERQNSVIFWELFNASCRMGTAERGVPKLSVLNC